MQSAYFCKQEFGLSLAVYIPETTEFGMDFGGNPVPVRLDGSYVAYPSAARQHTEEALAELKCAHQFCVPVERIGGTMPLLPNEWAMMTCPRVMPACSLASFPRNDMSIEWSVQKKADLGGVDS